MAPLNVDIHTVRANPLEVVEAGEVKLPAAPADSRVVVPDIIDIRREKISMCLKDEILKGLRKPEGVEKTLPTMLLYSEEGLKTFEEITYLPEYYLTNCEIEILHNWGDHMAERIKDGSVVVELGSGNLRKVNIFLTALERQKKHVDYYALDLSHTELQRTLCMVKTETFQYVRFHGLYGTYDDGRAWFKEAPEIKDRPRCIIHLGSSLGNFNKDDAAVFLKEFAQDVLRPGKPDYMLLGLDGCKEPEKVWTAYNDPHKCTERFIMSGLKQANEVMGSEMFEINKWDYVGEWNAEEGRHQAYLVPKEDIKLTGELEGVTVKKGERVNIEYSYKFDDRDAKALWEYAGVTPGAQWSNDAGDYSLYLLNRSYFQFPLRPSEYAADPLPSIDDWESLWKAWDTVTLDMIPQSQLLSKPINLRNPCIFYLGHIPTFLDVMLQKGGDFKPIGPARFQEIFQRGIDPDVDDPTKCHQHSEIPEEWPSLFEILHHTREVRDRVRTLYSSDRLSSAPLLQRALWTAFEHEAMHLETLLYMLLQSDSTQPPPGVIPPDFASPPTSERRRPTQEWHRIPATTLTIGLDDPEHPPLPTPHHFGWDNEKPARRRAVPAFTARAHPITNEEYARYLHATRGATLPACWTTTHPLPLDPAAPLAPFIARTAVRTVFGRAPLAHALDWPAMGSYDELAGCAAWLGGRIPSADQVRALYDHAAALRRAEKKLGHTLPAVNAHLLNDGVCETPPQGLFADLSEGNVAFRFWRPTAVRVGRLLGRGETGGAWEWTSTVLEKHDGFVPGRLYPEYTADFFDGKHNVVLGGSWATHSRVAGRKSFVNWYQRNYKYVWAGARIIKDE